MVGGKGANLGELARAGFKVPPGFCVCATAYKAFIEAHRLREAIAHLLTILQSGDPTLIAQVAQDIQARILGKPILAEIADEVTAAYEKLGPEFPVAVRSSATAEDLPEASFAGQQETFLNVRGVPALLEKLHHCWASLWSERSISYRQVQGFDHLRVYLAAVVQQMIPAEASGVLFAADPISNDRGVMVINSSWGLGEAIVSGLVSPDAFTVLKSDLSIVDRVISSKETMIAYADAGGTIQVAVPLDRREVPSLAEAQIVELARVGRSIETHYGEPQDIEWAYAGGQLYVLQARPITTLKEEIEWNRSMFVELFPEPLSPIFTSVLKSLLQGMLDFTFRTLGFRPSPDMEAAGIFYNHPFFNRQYIEKTLAGLPPRTRDKLAAEIMNPFGEQEGELSLEPSPPALRMGYGLLRFMLSALSQLPRIIERYQQELAAIESAPIETQSDRQVVDHLLHIAYRSLPQLLNYDFLMIALTGIMYQVLGRILRAYFGSEAEALHAQLISGVAGNMTVKTNKGLWDLAAQVRRSPALRRLFQTTPAEDLLSALRTNREPEVHEFMGALDRFLKEYGHREIRIDIVYPTWKEDATPVFGFIQRYLEADEEASPYVQEERLGHAREEAERRIDQRLGRDLRGRLIRPLFRWILRHSQEYSRERDTMHFYMTASFPILRRIVFELGRRWTQPGWLDKPEDLFFVTIEELKTFPDQARPLQDLVRERRAEWERSKDRAIPIIIRGRQEIYAEEARPGQKQVRGTAGSPGRIRGRARLIRGPEDFHRLQRGEILVAPLTTPVWTPLFAVAAGLVTDTGGILSHGSIVAREYGIPAVVGSKVATQLIADGQMITVDG
ncbi:MAG: hypothetical protein HYZ68_05425, partial [Chloroflexi bacterium]|nr:hypothetical protein [Chloroflexota bacterium]